MVTRALDVVLLGPPGAGKGTQAARLAGSFGILHISTGNVLREEVARGTGLGHEAAEWMRLGELVPDELVGKILLSRLHAQGGALGAVYDGYPRTARQADLLDGLLAELNRRVDIVASLSVPDDEVIARLAGRRTCVECGAAYHVPNQSPRTEGICDACGAQLHLRDDDREEVVAERLRVYRERTAPLLELYRGRGVLREVDGVGSLDEVFQRLCGVMRAAR